MSDRYLLYRSGRKKAAKGGRKRRQRGEEKGKKEKIKLLILLCAYNHLSQLAWR